MSGIPCIIASFEAYSSLPPPPPPPLQVVSLSALRSFFLVGAAYYELGRHGFSRRQDDAYLSLMTAAFAAGTVSAALSSYVTYYTLRLRTAAQQVRFCELADPYVRHSYRFFLTSLSLYLCSFVRVGYVYYPDSNNRACTLLLHPPSPTSHRKAVCLAFRRVYSPRHHVRRGGAVHLRRLVCPTCAQRRQSWQPGLGGHV